jgi:hypothetical protein
MTGISAIGDIELGVGKIDIWSIIKELIMHVDVVRKYSVNGIVIDGNVYGE